MRTLYMILVIIVAAAGLVGCGGPPANSNVVNATATNADKTDNAAAPTVGELKALETRAYEAYRNKDVQFFNEFLTDNYGGSGTGRRLDKAATIKMIAENKCDIKSFSFSDETLTKLGAATALLTMKGVADGVCEGRRRMPGQFLSATLYVNVDAGWRAAWHGEVPVVDPKAPPAADNAGDNKPSPEPTYRTMPDSQTGELAAIEKSVWEAWMNRDAKRLDELTARELAFVNIFGDHFRNRTETLKNWSENPCEIKSVNVGNPTSVPVTPDTSILFHKGTAEGTCSGQKVGPILGTSVYVKEGPAWKVAFTMNMPIL